MPSGMRRQPRSSTECCHCDPDLLDAMLLRGLAAYLAGALPTARTVWERAAALHPDDGRVQVYRSMLGRGTEPLQAADT